MYYKYMLTGKINVYEFVEDSITILGPILAPSHCGGVCRLCVFMLVLSFREINHLKIVNALTKKF